MNSRAREIHFTFYLSAAGLISDQNRGHYENPSTVLVEAPEIARSSKSKFKEKSRRLSRGRSFQAVGESNIDFGGSDFDVIQRIAFINKIYKEGNEIASHAVGHFDGSDWTAQMWRHEFQEYERVLTHVSEINGSSKSEADKYSLAFSPNEIRGFRAPFLARNENMLSVLREFHFDYDSSNPDRNYDAPTWPEKIQSKETGNELWDLGLGMVNLPKRKASGKVTGTKRVTAMDYNFCFEQTNGCENVNEPKNAKRDAEDMLHSYFEYFLEAYNKNRAPLTIGHHFFPYRGGVYNQALLKFAKIICNLPEVECGTSSELVEFLKTKSENQLKLFQGGNFSKASYRPSLRELIVASEANSNQEPGDHGK